MGVRFGHRFEYLRSRMGRFLTWEHFIALVKSGAGVGGAQVISLLMIPLISRLYLPEAFGQYASVTAMIAVFISVSSLKYDLAIPVAESRQEAVGLLVLCMLVNFLTTALVLPLFFAFGLFGLDSLFTLALVFGLMQAQNLFQCLLQFCRWQDEYGLTSIGNVSNAIVAGVATIAFGWFAATSDVMILSTFLGYLVASLVMIAFNWRALVLEPSESVGRFSRYRRLARSYCRFSLYLVPGQLLNALAMNLPTVFIMRFFGPHVAGIYSMTNRLLLAPVTLVSRTISMVFYRLAKKERASRGHHFAIFRSFAGLLLIFNFLVFGGVVLLRGYLPVILDPSWAAVSGVILILAPCLFFRGVSAPLSTSVLVAGMQKWDLIWQVGNLVLVCAGLWSGWVLGRRDSDWFFVAYGASLSVSYLFQLTLSFCAARRPVADSPA